MQKEMKKMQIEGFSENEKVRIVLNGMQGLEDLEIDESLLSSEKNWELVNSIKQAHKDATKKVQKEMAKGMDMDKMKSMLGGL